MSWLISLLNVQKTEMDTMYLFTFAGATVCNLARQMYLTVGLDTIDNCLVDSITLFTIIEPLASAYTELKICLRIYGVIAYFSSKNRRYRQSLR